MRHGASVTTINLMPPSTPSTGTPILDYQAPPEQRPRFGGFGSLTLKAVTAYFVVSSLTLPFIDALWMGEVPLLAVIQLPKTALAGWLRTDVVMPAIGALGLSSGSFSPDYVMARPYALAIAYLAFLGLVFLSLWFTKQMKGSCRRWLWITLIAAAIDFGFTLYFAGRTLTVY